MTKTHTIDALISTSYTSNSPFYLFLDNDLSMRLGFSKISTWTTAGRPAGIEGSFGYNLDLNQLEIYARYQWRAITVEGGDADEVALRYSFMMH